MDNVVKFPTHLSQESPWESSFPGISRADPSWMIDVLADLVAFADQNSMIAVADELAASLEKIRDMI